MHYFDFAIAGTYSSTNEVVLMVLQFLLEMYWLRSLMLMQALDFDNLKDPHFDCRYRFIHLRLCFDDHLAQIADH